MNLKNFKFFLLGLSFFVNSKNSLGRVKVFASHEIDKDKIPQHLAIIMDGNGRWATCNGKDRSLGHCAGIPVFKTVVQECNKLKIKYLSVFAFAKANWSRPKNEVDYLFELMNFYLEKEVNELIEANIRLRFIGDFSPLPEKLKKVIQTTQKLTENCNGMQLIIAINYSTTWEICNAINNMLLDVKTGLLRSNVVVDATMLNSYLQTTGLPNPDLLIRTGGELRLSEYYGLQLVFTELYFSEVLWPDFCIADLYEALWNYQKRERRFGNINSTNK